MHYSDDVKIQIKRGRKKFIAMAITYCLGVFNDNFFKQVALLLAVAAGMNKFQGYATILFSLPFVLFSAYAGWLADRFPKKYVIIGTKFLELAAMIAGAIGVLTLNWYFIMTMVFLMALQSTIFSPALNGSIPELYPEEYINEANAIVKLVTTLFILMGIGLAGVALDQNWYPTEIPFGRVLVAIIILAVSGVGVIASFGVFKHNPDKRPGVFPWAGPYNSLRHLFEVNKDKPLLLALMGSSFFYSISSLAVLVINSFGKNELKLSNTMTSLMIVSLMIGVCIGSFIAAHISNNKNWTKMPAPSTLGMGIGFLLTAVAPLLPVKFQIIESFIALVITGMFAGMLLIPIVAFIQVRPAANEKGKVLGIENFLDFSGIILAGVFYNILIDWKLLPSYSILVIGIIALIVGTFFYFLVRKEEYKL